MQSCLGCLPVLGRFLLDCCLGRKRCAGWNNPERKKPAIKQALEIERWQLAHAIRKYYSFSLLQSIVIFYQVIGQKISRLVDSRLVNINRYSYFPRRLLIRLLPYVAVLTDTLQSFRHR